MLAKLLFNFSLPPLSAIEDARRTVGRFERPLYQHARNGAIIGLVLGIIGILSTLVIKLMGYNFPLFFNTYGLLLYIGLPWLLSAIGRGIGFFWALRALALN